MTINGSDLMVFVKVNGALKSIAFATSHTLDISLNTVDTSTKDNGNGMWQNNEPGMASWSMSSENLMSDSAENGASMNDLFDIFLKRQKVEVVFALQGNNLDYSAKLGEEFKAPETGWTPDTKNQYKGEALITSLSVNAANGEKATASVSFTGCGNLMKVGEGLKSSIAVAQGPGVISVPTSDTTKTTSK